MNPEFQESILICAVIFCGIGAGILILHGIGLAYRGIMDLFGNKGMIGRMIGRR